jgi:hypothetical protein
MDLLNVFRGVRLNSNGEPPEKNEQLGVAMCYVELPCECEPRTYRRWSSYAKADKSGKRHVKPGTAPLSGIIGDLVSGQISRSLTNLANKKISDVNVVRW